MNALNEVNKVISNVSFQSSRHSQMEEDEWLTADKMAVSGLCQYAMIITQVCKERIFSMSLLVCTIKHGD